VSDAFDFDPFDPANWDDPYPAYRVMREQYPVYRHATPYGRVSSHYWMLSRAADVNAALGDWRRFSSARGVLVDTDLTGVSDSPPLLFDADPPRHDEIRSVLSRVLTQSRITGLEPHVRAYAEELAAAFGSTGRFDVSTDFGQLIPTITMCSLLDLPVTERQQFLKWNLDTLGGQDFASEVSQRAWLEMGEYWKDVVKQRRAHSGPDLISQILLAQAEGPVPISDQDNVTIPAGDQVLLLFGSANHDEAVFDHPEVLDFDRPVGLNWTFGHGIHHCLGSAVAKLETRVAVQVLLEELRDWEVDEDAIERSQLVPTRGVAHAPATCSAGRGR
jgi:cytochrome P450